MASRREGRSIWFRLGLWLAAVYLAGFAAFALTLPEVRDPPQDADAVVALTGGGERIDAAIALFESGVGRRLLISGVNPATTKDDLRRVAGGGARFDCCADLGFEASDTAGNAREAASWAAARGYRRLVVVTAAYHMPRSLLEFGRAMPEAELLPYPVMPANHGGGRWWENGEALRIVHSEYMKYLASLARNVLPGAA